MRIKPQLLVRAIALQILLLLALTYGTSVFSWNNHSSQECFSQTFSETNYRIMVSRAFFARNFTAAATDRIRLMANRDFTLGVCLKINLAMIHSLYTKRENEAWRLNEFESLSTLFGNICQHIQIQFKWEAENSMPLLYI